MVDNENSSGAKHLNCQFFTHFSRKLTGFSRTSHGFSRTLALLTTCFYHDVWSADITARIQCPTKVESAGLTGTLPKFKLNLHVEDQGKLVNVRQRLPTNGVNGDKLFNGILSIDPLLGQPWIGKNPKYDMVNIVGTDVRLLTKTTTLGLVIYYTRLVALRKHGNVYDQLESKVPRLLVNRR